MLWRLSKCEKLLADCKTVCCQWCNTDRQCADTLVHRFENWSQLWFIQIVMVFVFISAVRMLFETCKIHILFTFSIDGIRPNFKCRHLSQQVNIPKNKFKRNKRFGHTMIFMEHTQFKWFHVSLRIWSMVAHSNGLVSHTFLINDSY